MRVESTRGRTTRISGHTRIDAIPRIWERDVESRERTGASLRGLGTGGSLHAAISGRLPGSTAQALAPCKRCWQGCRVEGGRGDLVETRRSETLEHDSADIPQPESGSKTLHTPRTARHHTPKRQPCLTIWASDFPADSYTNTVRFYPTLGVDATPTTFKKLPHNRFKRRPFRGPTALTFEPTFGSECGRAQAAAARNALAERRCCVYGGGRRGEPGMFVFFGG